MEHQKSYLKIVIFKIFIKSLKVPAFVGNQKESSLIKEKKLYIYFRSHRTDENSTSNCSLNLFIHSTPPPVPLHPYAIAPTPTPVPLHPYATAPTPTPVPLHPYATAPTPTPVPLHPYPTAFLASSPVRPLPPSTQPPPPLPSQNINNLSDSVRPPSLPRRVSHKSPKISPSQSPTRPGPPLFQRTVERRRPPPLPPKSSNSDI